MIRSDVSALALSSLFSALLAGCSGAESGCEGYVPQENTVPYDLPRADYEALKMGAMTTSGGSTEGETTTDGSTSDGSSTDGSTAGGSTSGEELSDAEICEQVCTANYGDAPVSCSIGPQEGAEDVLLVSCVYLSICIGGRGHEGVRSRGDAAGIRGDAAGWLARARHDEGASVRAFEALAQELAAWQAPAELVAALRAAAADEERHEAMIGALAEQLAAPVVAVEFFEDRSRRRALAEIAAENAAQGCVFETWAALVAAHQGQAAALGLRACFLEIARDEARHAALAWAIDRWIRGRLTEAELAVVEAARSAAVARLRADPGMGAVEAATQALLGLPSPGSAQRLVAGLEAALWSAAA